MTGEVIVTLGAGVTQVTTDTRFVAANEMELVSLEADEVYLGGSSLQDAIPPNNFTYFLPALGRVTEKIDTRTAPFSLRGSTLYAKGTAGQRFKVIFR